MKLDVQIELNLKSKEVTDAVKKAGQAAMKDTVVDIANDVIHLSPVITGHNRRSIAYEVGGEKIRLGKELPGEKPFIDWQPDLKQGQAAIYSTSGYGGFLETGTVKMAARPYFKPALDKNYSAEKFAAKMKEHMQ